MDVKNAIKCMILSTLAFACMNAIVKCLDNVNTYQIVFFRSFGSLFFTFGYLFKNKIPLIGNKNKLLILRSIVGATSMLFFFMSIKYLSVGTAVSLRYTAPIFCSYFCCFHSKRTNKTFTMVVFCYFFFGSFSFKRY